MVIIIRNNYERQVTIRNENERKRVHTRSGSWEVADPTPAGWWPTLQVLELDLDGQSGLSVSIVVQLFKIYKEPLINQFRILKLFQNKRITCSNSNIRQFSWKNSQWTGGFMVGYLISFKKILVGRLGGGARIVITYQNWVFDFVWILIMSLSNRPDTRRVRVCSCSK